MQKLHARAQLIKGFQITLDNGRSHSVTVDQPAEMGTDLGPTSLELCVMSHAGCYATIFALTAKKMRIHLASLEVKVEAIKTDEEGTIIQETFDVTVKAEAPMDRIQRLHELTLKNCPVGILFEKAGVKLSYKINAARITA